jgi:hypothetical protein
MRMLGASFGVVLCIASLAMFTGAAVDRNHDAFNTHTETAERCLQGDLEAARTLKHVAPELAESIRVARRDGMAAAFAIQWLLAGGALLIALKLVHTRPPGEDPESE